MIDNAPLLETRDLAKSFGPVQALRSADLVVAEGEVHALLGANGAGKSTLVKLLTGVLTADRGIVLLRNMLRREIAKVQQGLDPIGVIRDPAQAVINTHPETLMDNRPRWLTPNGVRMFAEREPAAVG